jgi:lysophospholipase L1-like esterase
MPNLLPRWRSEIGPTAKIALVGDSTSVDTYLGFAATFAAATGIGSGLRGMTNDASHFIIGGSSGKTAHNFLTDGTYTYPYTRLVTDAPNLIILSFGINDITILLSTQAQFVADMTAIVNRIQTDLPNADIVLRMPNSFLSVGPMTTPQIYTDTIRNAYLSLVGVWPNVVVADLQTNVFGTTCPASSDLMANSGNPQFDQAHPGAAGEAAIINYIVATCIGWGRAPVASRTSVASRTAVSSRTVVASRAAVS